MRYTRAALQQQLSRILLSVRPPDDERFAHIYATSRAELLDYITHLTDEDDSVLIKRLPAASRLQFHTSGAKLAARNEYLRVLQPLQDYFSEFVAARAKEQKAVRNAFVDGQAGRPRRARGRPLRYRHPRARRPERPHGGAVRRAHTAAGAGTTSLRVKLEAEGCWAPAPTYGRWACTRSAAEKLAHVLQTAWRAAAEPVRVGGRGPGARQGGAGEARAPPAGLPRCLCVPQC